MKLDSALCSALLALTSAHAAIGRHILPKRQDSTEVTDTSGSPSTQPSSSARSSASTTRDGSTTLASSGTATDSATSKPSSATGELTTSRSSVSSNTATAAASQTSGLSTSATPSATNKPEQLPLKPTITPALGIAGCILIIAGAALCLVGIKHKWLHVFLSTALLASLAVTVLIIYVMNPPVSNGIQGAYMVAAVITGLIFGSLALVFKEVTEGLGCLLGGFCLAMWFLVLSPGGIISTTTGRAILIAVFCIVFFGLSFSQYTRTYGLIIGTSFAGAQIAVIGVDCFSRAGLKEFWLYLWSLNGNAFPINTSTYPITRGIRVEIACTVIMASFGVMSQFKIWKVVKERRARKDADRLREGADKDQLEETVGRDVEASNQRDREQWEAVYGDKNEGHVQVDSGVGSSVESLPQKHSTSVRQHEVDNYELADMPGTASTQHTRSEGLHASPRDLPTQSEELLINRNIISRPGSLDSRHEHDTASHHDRGSTRSSLKQASSFDGPAVVPLPFSIPTETDDDEVLRDGGSVVLSGTAGQSVNERRGMPLRQLLLRRDGKEHHDDDDGGSSVAATADGEIDEALVPSPRHSKLPDQYILDFDEEGQLPNAHLERSRTPSPSRSVLDVPLEEDDEEAIVRPSTALEEVSSSPARGSVKHRRRRSTASARRRSVDQYPTRYDTSRLDDDTVSLVGSLKDHLPQKFSKVALTYRTNEWAKHITDADQPAPEDEAESHSPSVQVDHAFAEEAAKPVDVEALKPVTLTPSRTDSQSVNNNPYRRSMQPTPNGLLRTSSSAATPIYSVQRSSSSMSMNRKISSGSLSAQHRPGVRKSSAPLMTQPLDESPIEDALADTEPYRNFSTPMSNHNLMGERQQRLKRKPTSTSFNALVSNPDLNLIAPSDSASVRDMTLEAADADNISLSERKQLLDEENMSLAERRAMMRTQSPPDAFQLHNITDRSRSRQSSAPSPAGPAYQSNVIYDSHQPKRSNTVDTDRKVNMLTNWRQSMQQDVAAKQPLLADEGARQIMMSERRRAEQEQHRQQAERANRESVMELAMRNGQFHGAHRDAMRRLQAKANKSTG
ncbi:hypothetical protein LTR56_008051 [Elasticomyces elasticus]|nr:hypothetical protein LTR56_008051 [Elasticomyces elasticus]KAK3665806.1 hypothetical protein LTR22_003437 [Elasticomyces elasticus]KAK4926276.1 hypothetical protein LTR49_006748 [Elasticomyces elasticus]KAK5761988.1 hypothetical protein LTS12_007860 [Elasticomyces elasticus]